jgi:LacI family transcriptional regulator
MFRNIIIFFTFVAQTISHMNGKNNLAAISDRTGYSVSTVSRVLSGKAEKYRISQSAVERITKEARRCGYRPNLVAQSLRTRQSQTVGLVVPGIDNPFFATLASIVIAQLGSRGYHTLLADSRESEEEERQALEMFQDRGVDGILAVPVASSPKFHEEVGANVPLVLIDRYFQKTSLSYVCTDNYAGAYMAAQYLVEKGYKNILAIQGVPASMPNRERVRGFLDAIKGHGVESKEVGDAFSVENGSRETLAAFAGNPKAYDAVFAFSATILVGTISSLRKLGITEGKDVGVISYDNNGFFDFMNPPVTRVEQPLQEAGEIAVETLFSLMQAHRSGLPNPAPVQQLVRPTLIIRESC